MGYPSVKVKCCVCKRSFMAEYGVVKKVKMARGTTPACSRACEQERRHQASRDAKWQAHQAKILKEGNG